MKKTIQTNRFYLHIWLITFWLFFGIISLSAQTYQLIATESPSVQTKVSDVKLRFLLNNQVEYYITNGQWQGWSLAFEWGAPQITYQPDGQLLSINTRAWIVTAGSQPLGAGISVTFQGLTDGNRLINTGRAYTGFSSADNRYVNGNNTAQIKMTEWDEPEIIASVMLTDGRGTNVLLAAYTFRRTDLSTATSITLQQPEMTHNIISNGEYWMSVKPTGWISGFGGRKIQLVTRFYYSNETPLYASAQEATYRDVNGLVAAATPPIQVTAQTMDLSQQVITIPYRALNLPYTGGQATYNLFLFVDVFVDGQLQKQSVRAPFTVNW